MHGTDLIMGEAPTQQASMTYWHRHDDGHLCTTIGEPASMHLKQRMIAMWSQADNVPPVTKVPYTRRAVTLTAQEFKSLAPKEQVNAGCIDALVEIINEAIDLAYTVQTYHTSGMETGRELTGARDGMDFGAASMILAPLCINNNHWILLFADSEQRQLAGYGPLWRTPAHSERLEKFRSWLQRRIQQSHIGAMSLIRELPLWRKAHAHVWPTQTDDTSCGVFVMAAIIAVFERRAFKLGHRSQGVDLRVRVAQYLLASDHVVDKEPSYPYTPTASQEQPQEQQTPTAPRKPKPEPRTGAARKPTLKTKRPVQSHRH